MDAARIIKNRRGIAIVYVAVLLTVLIAFAGLAIDIGYKFVTKSQLQNAADSGALAGAGYYKDELIKKYRNPSSYVISNVQVKNVAEQFAEEHIAAAAPVQIANDTTSNTISSANDITLGFWNYTAAINANKYNDLNPNPINAVKVRARRTSDSPAGAIGTFFGKVLGWDFLNAEATAIAAIPSGAGLYIAFCEIACSSACVFPNICDITPPRIMEKPVPPNFPYERALTWTTLTTSPSSADVINGLLCTEMPYKQVCSRIINTNTGSINSQFQNLESLMYNLTIDRSNKDINATTGEVDAWWAIVPVMEKDPLNPTECLLDDDRKVVKYALIRIRVVCSSGNVGTNKPNEEPLCIGTSKAPSGLCGGGKPYPNDSIVIDKISCINCDESVLMPGLKVQLVK